MSFSISLPTTQFFPDPVTHAGNDEALVGRLPGMSLQARAACACVAITISTALLTVVAWGMTATTHTEPAAVAVATADEGSR
jgi:hypothetical protein